MQDMTQQFLLLFVAFPIGILIFVIVVTRLIMGRVGKKLGQDTAVLQNGEAARATILDLDDTGATVNENPVIKLHLLVEVSNRPAYTVSKTMLISRLQIPPFQPGQALNVRIDPKNPNNVAIAAIG